MMKCDCGNEVNEDECWDPGVNIKLFEGKGMKVCKKCWLNSFSKKRINLIQEYIESLKIKYTPPTYEIIKIITDKKNLEIGNFYLLGSSKICFYGGTKQIGPHTHYLFEPLDLSNGYIIDNENKITKEYEQSLPKNLLPPKELMDYVASRPVYHMIGAIVDKTMELKEDNYQLIKLTSEWSNDFGSIQQTGISKPFVFKEKTLLEELELTEADLNNADIKKVVEDLENWGNKGTYAECFRITKELVGLYKERG